MSDSTLLSSEQALDEYFSSLLDEEFEQELASLEEEEAQAEATGTNEIAQDLEPLPQVSEGKSYYHLPTEEVALPNLEDVERLLQQLESSNPVADLDLEEVMNQNTSAIAEQTVEIPDVEVVDVAQVEEEIQDWELEASSEPLIENEQTEPEEALQVEVVERIDTTIAVEENAAADVDIDVSTETELETQAGGQGIENWHSTARTEDFQVLYFDVNNVTFAVPLDELGGIHRMDELNHLIGRPDWYLGLQTSRENQLDVVDTARWVMAEKLTDDEYKQQYQYIVMLGESLWGLASTELLGTELLNTDKVRWRETAGKRPWLAGMVKEKMCALIHVEALIAMLNAGLDVKALDN